MHGLTSCPTAAGGGHGGGRRAGAGARGGGGAAGAQGGGLRCTGGRWGLGGLWLMGRTRVEPTPAPCAGPPRARARPVAVWAGRARGPVTCRAALGRRRRLCCAPAPPTARRLGATAATAATAAADGAADSAPARRPGRRQEGFGRCPACRDSSGRRAWPRADAASARRHSALGLGRPVGRTPTAVRRRWSGGPGPLSRISAPGERAG